MYVKSNETKVSKLKHWKKAGETLSENAEKNKLQIMSLKTKDWFQKTIIKEMWGQKRSYLMKYRPKHWQFLFNEGYAVTESVPLFGWLS